VKPHPVRITLLEAMLRSLLNSCVGGDASTGEGGEEEVTPSQDHSIIEVRFSFPCH
jgi:hypothetical protein